jgi:prolyl-tRNA editing enzyme YbaK/EbsC (Cys-tRNA(Pro) deacylase)
MAESSTSTRSSAERVRDALASQGIAADIREFDACTRTSADAAAAIGCQVAQIAKSLVFRAKPSGRPVLAIASGVNRVSEALLAAALGEGIAKADAAFVRDKTGFAIGGVAPVGHAERPAVFIDEDLLRYSEIWAAAGTPSSVFRLTPGDLQRITGGRVIALKEPANP